jgi:hypothetical protein
MLVHGMGLRLRLISVSRTCSSTRLRLLCQTYSGRKPLCSARPWQHLNILFPMLRQVKGRIRYALLSAVDFRMGAAYYYSLGRIVSGRFRCINAANECSSSRGCQHRTYLNRLPTRARRGISTIIRPAGNGVGQTNESSVAGPSAICQVPK